MDTLRTSTMSGVTTTWTWSRARSPSHRRTTSTDGFRGWTLTRRRTKKRGRWRAEGRQPYGGGESQLACCNHGPTSRWAWRKHNANRTPGDSHRLSRCGLGERGAGRRTRQRAGGEVPDGSQLKFMSFMADKDEQGGRTG